MLIFLGIGIHVVGQVYQLFYAGIPYQDPIPEVYANWLFHSHIGNSILAVGLIMLLIGVVWWLYAMFKPKLRTRHKD